MKMNSFRALEARATMLLADESGMSTVEYAIGTVAAAASVSLMQTPQRRPLP